MVLTTRKYYVLSSCRKFCDNYGFVICFVG